MTIWRRAVLCFAVLCTQFCSSVDSTEQLKPVTIRIVDGIRRFRMHLKPNSTLSSALNDRLRPALWRAAVLADSNGRQMRDLEMVWQRGPSTIFHLSAVGPDAIPPSPFISQAQIAWAYFNMGWLLVSPRYNDFEQGAQAFRLAAAVDPFVPVHHIELCKALRRLRRNDEAMKVMLNAASLLPFSDAVLLHLGYIHHVHGQLNKAAAAYQKSARAYRQHGAQGPSPMGEGGSAGLVAVSQAHPFISIQADTMHRDASGTDDCACAL